MRDVHGRYAKTWIACAPQHAVRCAGQQGIAHMLYCIIADGTFDQVCETKAQADKEKRDLTRMGCEVKVKAVKDWAEAHALEDKISNQ